MSIRLRSARTSDVNAIRGLVAPLAERRVLIAKEAVAYYEGLQEFVVAERDAEVVGCGALHVLWEDLAEVRTLAVAPAVKGQRGRARAAAAHWSSAPAASASPASSA